MTRLRTEWISTVEDTLINHDAELKKKMGCILAELAAKSCGMSLETFAKKAATHKIASISVTQGEGVIGSFAELVAATVKHIGADSFVTDKSDVSGLYEATAKMADIVFMADDERFIALNIKTGAIGENNKCTAIGYVNALELMAGDLSGRDVLVLGCGRVGLEIVEALKGKEAIITVYDIDEKKMQGMGSEIKEIKSKEGIKDFLYILDATNTGEWLEKDMLNEGVRISAPGIPLSLTSEAMEIYGDRVIHDLLPLGTAVMLGSVI